MTLIDALRTTINGDDLSEQEAHVAMTSIMTGQATSAQIAGFLVALRLKGEQVPEIAGFARAMLDASVSVSPSKRPLVDVCGTGGDGHSTFNISTTVAFVLAGAGLHVAKHGNRSVSSRCGSADVLEALGVRLDMEPKDVACAIDDIGIGFLYAPRFHPAMKHAASPRREMGIRTVFNMLGPLVNPAQSEIQLVGVYDPSLVEPMARVLQRLGCRSGAVVHGAGGMDELSTLGPNHLMRINGANLESVSIDPSALGLPNARIADLRGGDVAENAAILRAVLAGQSGARRNVVLLNAAVALWVAGSADSVTDGLAQATHSVDSGAALDRLDRLVRFDPGERGTS